MCAAISIPVVILAGGAGSRIGGRKELRILGGRNLIARTIDKAVSYSKQVAVSTGQKGELDLPHGIVKLADPKPGHGPISGLLSGLEYAAGSGSDYVMILPCDTPFLPDDLMSQLLQSIGQANASVAYCNGRLHATCSLWRVCTAEMLMSYLANSRRSLVGFAEAVGYKTVHWSSDHYDPFFNINNEADLATAEQILANTPYAHPKTCM